MRNLLAYLFQAAAEIGPKSFVSAFEKTQLSVRERRDAPQVGGFSFPGELYGPAAI